MKSFLRHSAALSVAPLLFVLVGCMADPIDRPEVKPRVVTAPSRVWFYATNYQAPTMGDLVVKWNHAASDTQQNFKGYFVQLYRSDSAAFEDSIESMIGEDSVLKVGNKVDTSLTFHNIAMGRYTVRMHGMQFADTTAFSRDSIGFSSPFDPRPLLNPTNLQATSIGPLTVKLRWDVPVTDTNSGLKYYQVYYMDIDTAHYGKVGPVVAHRGGATTLEATVGLTARSGQAGDNIPQQQAFRFWVKAVRIDDVQFPEDTSTIVWAGAPRVMMQDSGGYRHSLLFVNYQATGATMADDSVDNLAPMALSFNGSSVTLTASNGAMLNSRIDTAGSLDTVTYSAPITSGFTESAITLDPASSGLGGIVVYLQFEDDQSRTQYARIWIKQQADGSFVTLRTGVYAIASWQNGFTNDLRQHLPYY